MRTIVIFVKAPEPGRVKTRLVPAIGAERAAGFYETMARETYGVAVKMKKVEVLIAYDPGPAYPNPGWLLPSPAALPPVGLALSRRRRERVGPEGTEGGGEGTLLWFKQEGQDLGKRLIHAYYYAFLHNKGPVVAIGSDLPTMTPALLRKAFLLLDKASVVLGPSRDGGYYLIGLRRHEPRLFKGIPWSTDQVLPRTLKAIKNLGLPYRLLPVQRDIDTPEDLKAFMKSC